MYSVLQVPEATSKMMSLSMTASSSRNISSDEVTYDRYLGLFIYLVCKTIEHSEEVTLDRYFEIVISHIVRETIGFW